MSSWERLIELPRVLAGEAFRVEESEVAFPIVLNEADHPYGLSDPSTPAQMLLSSVPLLRVNTT
jgi:hypothetical protein